MMTIKFAITPIPLQRPDVWRWRRMSRKRTELVTTNWLLTDGDDSRMYDTGVQTQ